MKFRIVRRKPMMFIVAMATTFALTSALFTDRGHDTVDNGSERFAPVAVPIGGSQEARMAALRSL